jgi:hypothetical protein
VNCVRGEVHYRLECRPAMDYARQSHRVVLSDKGARCECDGPLIFGLLSPIKLTDSSPAVTADFTLTEGQHLSFVFFGGPAICSVSVRESLPGEYSRWMDARVIFENAAYYPNQALADAV